MPSIKTKSFGPANAEVMIVGEAPGHDEEIKGIPFIGSSGDELTRMLHEANFVRSECFLTNVCKYRPPENKIESFFLDSRQTKPNALIEEGLKELNEDIARLKPKLIIAFGNTALWALTGNRGIVKWRGSMLSHPSGAMLLPTYHPAAVLREWAWRSTAVHDLRRANAAYRSGSWPKRENRYFLRPSFEQVMDTLGDLQARAGRGVVYLSSDLETRAGYIACHGLAWSNEDAISIPFMCVERPTGYWTLEQEIAIWERQRALMLHPYVRIVGQNWLYDVQYFARRWGYAPTPMDDTLIMQNVLFPGQPKGLDYLSSIYCEQHVYWKDEGKLWNPKLPEDKLWGYNCDDATRTFEIRAVLEKSLKQAGLWQLYRFQMQVWQVALEMMLRGVRIDQLSRGIIAGQMLEAIGDREQAAAYITRRPLNVRSPKQVHFLFYDQLKRRVIRDRKTRKPTCNDEAMEIWAREEPLLRPLIQAISDVRSLGVVFSNVIKAPLDADGRIRSSFSPTAETFRWTSSENAFGGGTNLQNWTKGDEDKEESALRPGQAKIPNVRKLVIPDPGFEIASIDLTGADAQTVAWEADDTELKQVFRENKIKIHAFNAMCVWPQYCKTGYEQPYYDYIRTGVHLVNYGGKARTLSAAMVVTEAQAQWFINYWFKLHPGIQEWHERVQDRLQRLRAIYNAFGYRRYYFDRINDLLPEALAWLGQSTTACVTNRALVAMREAKQLMKDLQIEVLFQVHDEIVFQYPTFYREQVLKAVRPLVHIPIPYHDPLVIPWGLKTSTASWGQCEKRDWPV